MMRQILFVLLLFLASVSPASAQYYTLTTHDVTFTSPIPIGSLSSVDPARYLPPRTWVTVDLRTIDPRFAEVASVTILGEMSIVGPGIPGIGCQVWVEFVKPGVFAPTYTGGNYQWQLITESPVTVLSDQPIPYGGSVTGPTVQRPVKTVALTNGTFQLMWAFEPGCTNEVKLSLVGASLPAPVAPEPAFSVSPANRAVLHSGLQGVFIRSMDTPLPAGVWHTVDLRMHDPRFADVLSVDLEGILILSPTTPAGVPGPLCYLDVQLRGGGQTVTFSTFARSDYGSRWSVPNLQQPHATVPLTEGQFEMKWELTPGCAGGVNLKVISARLP